MRPRTATLATAVTLLTALVSAPTAPSVAEPLLPAPVPVPQAPAVPGTCDDLDTRACLLPFPNDSFTTLDPRTPTGRRVDLDLLEMPRNIAGKPVDPTEWNFNDGFSPGSPILTFVPGLDLARTFGLDATPETGPDSPDPDDPWAVRDTEPDALIEDPARSLARNAPIVLLDADTGERHPYWAELDENPQTLEQGADRTLVIRPLVNLEEGHRYIVALRDLRDASGAEIPAGAAFAGLRDGYAADCGAARGGCHPGRFPAPADLDPADREARYDDVFARLAARGVDIEELFLAWDFHVASAGNLAGRALAIRDDAFAQLGDTDLADSVVQGRSPDFTVTEATDEGNVRTVHGTVTVPNYLTTPQDQAPGVEVEGVGLVVPQSRFFYGAQRSGPGATPVQNPAVPTTEAEFVCRFRTDLPAVTPMLYGHGLLGSRNEATGSSSEDLRRSGYAACGVDWIGMATEDITNVALILQDVSYFGSLPDRTQQGFLNFMYVGRALLHEDGLGADPAFQVGGQRLLEERLVYDGNSQGGILGGGLTALAPDFTRSVLGVPGFNYSTLLNRSVDWEGDLVNPEEPGIPAYASFLYTNYPDKVDQQLLFALMQMLWDRGEGNGYAHHLTADPYPNTPAHQVLFEVAFGDYQVANVAAEVAARTSGADFLGTALADGRHWERAYATGLAEAPFGLTPFVPGTDGTLAAPSGSGLVYWDSGNPTPPNGNTPPWYLGQDPHSDPRKDDTALLAKLRFLATGELVDVNAGLPNWTANCPRHPEHDPGC